MVSILKTLAVAVVATASVAVCNPVLAQDKANWPKTLTLGTASVGGTYFIYGQVWATLVGEKIGIPINTQQTQGPNQNIILTQQKDIDLGMTTMGVALQAWEGKGWAKEKYSNIRALFPMYDTPFHFVALKRSGIKSVKDLNGKNIGVGPKAGTPGTYFPIMFDALGIKATIRNGQASDMSSQVADGLLASFAFAAGLPIAAFSELEATNEVTFFGFTDDEIKKLQAAAPELSETVIPKATYKSMTQDDKTVGVYNFAIAHKDLPASLTYEIVKAIHANHGELVKGHSAAKETLPENVTKNTFLPFHPGAARYYKEAGIAIPEKLLAN
ncbi:MAG: TAXI family TRAP transporter solute-binding subunit [Alphaproteobacteria bacterium]|nr:TAXI family TRAP transporter solute-binding subunit [Alphaproteobacteria bacterium]MBU0798198.1 TAXI family TRAP transporter solute-binding subunit [Alphaproteobacteria bacterium]MBU0887584.1 TAXI family TRAP transporter solute-binding subunit [Alphaproteobacteria bacterium]MBU1814235.1 TAXI family TRAP transporter solute-binding subunit [Alphaproteobacteria bacterium]